jgi:CheY-like chemotaxis protein
VSTPCRILVVDDETTITTSLATFFRSAGFDTETAADGMEALDKVASLVTSSLRCPLYCSREGLVCRWSDYRAR